MIIYDYKQLRQKEINEVSTRQPSIASATFFLGAKSFALLVAFAYFDAVIGGGIAEVLRVGGWSPLDQKINDMYQAGYGIGVVVIMVMLIARKSSAAIMCAPFIVFYCEDTFYYLLQPLASPVIEWLIGFTTPAVKIPHEISGWLGWTMRVVFNNDYAFDIWQVYLLNAIGVAITAIGLIEHARQK